MFFLQPTGSKGLGLNYCYKVSTLSYATYTFQFHLKKNVLNVTKVLSQIL